MLSIAQLAQKHGIVPLKQYSQNFIFDSSLCDKIVRASQIPKGADVLEIGPGTGGLTRSILHHAPNKLTVIETDLRCVPLLNELKDQFPALEIIIYDALKFDINELKISRINIISNLPYQIGTELLIKWLRSAHLIESMTLMLQKEVVDRIKARVSTKAYGRLSVICQLICDIEKCFDVKAEAFYPPPKVQSTIVRLLPKRNLIYPQILSKVENITRFAFGQRRKMLKSALKTFIPNIDGVLNKLNIPTTYRAENLAPQDYLNISDLI